MYCLHAAGIRAFTRFTFRNHLHGKSYDLILFLIKIESFHTDVKYFRFPVYIFRAFFLVELTLYFQVSRSFIVLKNIRLFVNGNGVVLYSNLSFVTCRIVLIASLSYNSKYQYSYPILIAYKTLLMVFYAILLIQFFPNVQLYMCLPD